MRSACAIAQRGDWWKRGNVAVVARRETPMPICEAASSDNGDRAAAQVKEHICGTEGWKYSDYWVNIEKKGIKLLPKTIGNRKEDCAWRCSRWQTQPEEICKLQLQNTNQYNVRSEWQWFVQCDLQNFSGCVCYLDQVPAQSPFLFPNVFGNNFTFNSTASSYKRER